MAKKSTTKKPEKPYPDFPLWPHPSGRWCKKIKGRFHYFGPWGEPDRAISLWKAQRDDLLAGRAPSATEVDDDGKPVIEGCTVEYLCNAFATSKKRSVEAGALTAGTYHQYLRVCKLIVNVLGKHRSADSIGPADFASIKAEARKTANVQGTSEKVRLTRSVFKWASEMQLIDKPATFGPDFKQASQSELRILRQRHEAEHGVNLFTADEINKMLAAASPTLATMILLGANCGLGQADCSGLRTTHIDLDNGTLDYPRPKTGIKRRAFLWPESVEALQSAIENRNEPRGTTPKNSVFVTARGNTYCRTTANGTRIDSITLEFKKLAKKCGTKRKGNGFYTLRRVFETIAGETGDQVAVDRVMGHEDAGRMSTRYRKRIGDDRLECVCSHVREWLKPSGRPHQPPLRR